MKRIHVAPLCLAGLLSSGGAIDMVNDGDRDELANGIRKGRPSRPEGLAAIGGPSPRAVPPGDRRLD